MTNKEKRPTPVGWGGFDTTLLLFFLALEYGRSANVLSIDGTMMGLTLLMVLVLPYFLPGRSARPAFSSWLLNRGIVAATAFVMGLGIARMAGTILPEGVGFLPMTCLVITSLVSCYIQFYGVLRLRQAN